MAAFASLVCLTNTLDENIQVNLIPQNSQYIQALLQEASFFQDLLEKSLKTAKYLESRIRDVAYKALDIIDSHVANQLDDCLTCLASLFEEPEVDFDWDECLFKDLDEVMEEINSIKLEAIQIGENEEKPDIQPSISAPAGSSRPPSHGMTTNTMVGLDDQLKEIKTRLLSGSSRCEIVALVGMGGIGKTTLAQKVYNEKKISCHFDICGWTTVSQEHNVRNILLRLLDSMGKLTDELRIEDGEKLKYVLYKNLKHVRYLIVLDDMWDTQVLDDLRRILVNDENGSRILLTTRLKKVAEFDKSCPPHHVRFLNNEESWGLFCEKVFGHDCCPPELEKVGKEIVRNCRGLPLALNVIGGHLSKATRIEHHWRSVAKNLSETISLEDDGQCSSVLSLSYKYLPHHLKGCFLYMSIFPEDCEIKVYALLNLWIASGLIKQETSKSSKDVAKEYFLDLLERNLILVSKRMYNGKILKCRIHDLISDLCVKKAKNERFFHITNKSFCYDYFCGVDHVRVALHSGGLRAFYCYSWGLKDLPTMVNNQANLRFLSQSPTPDEPDSYCYRIAFHKLVHLHTIDTIISDYSNLNIWEMPQLRHVNTSRLTLPIPPPSEIEGGNSLTVLEKLETLTYAEFFIFTDEVLRRIPNLKKLALRHFQKRDDLGRTYTLTEEVIDWRQLRLNNLERLHKLESLSCNFDTFPTSDPVLLGCDITFPHSIKKLALACCWSPWEDMTIIGSLPNLQVLRLYERSFVGSVWKPNEGEFLKLKTLVLSNLNLVHWRAEADHFPQLQHLFIDRCYVLQKIPRSFGKIPTLQLIDLFDNCVESVYYSAAKIRKQQHDFCNESFRLVMPDVRHEPYEVIMPIVNAIVIQT